MGIMAFAAMGYAGDGHSTYPYIAFLIMTTSISVIYAWLFNASKQNLSTVIIFHAMNNTAAPLLPFLHAKPGVPESGYWVYAIINLIGAVIFSILCLNLNEKTRQQQAVYKASLINSST